MGQEIWINHKIHVDLNWVCLVKNTTEDLIRDDTDNRHNDKFKNNCQTESKLLCHGINEPIRSQTSVIIVIVPNSG